jgi:hypothetical protein
MDVSDTWHDKCVAGNRVVWNLANETEVDEMDIHRETWLTLNIDNSPTRLGHMISDVASMSSKFDIVVFMSKSREQQVL